MCKSCGVLMPDFTGAPMDTNGCVLPAGHAGPHRSHTNRGEVLWETDLDCDCEWCQLGEGDYCIPYWPVRA